MKIQITLSLVREFTNCLIEATGYSMKEKGKTNLFYL